MNKDQQELWKEIEEAGKHATPGEQAIIGMLALMLSHMQEQNKCMERVAKATEQFEAQFNQVSARGTSLLTE